MEKDHSLLSPLNTEVPRLCKIIVVPKAPSNSIENVQLAMEIVCGKKFIDTKQRFDRKVILLLHSY